MEALILKNARHLIVGEIPSPRLADHEVLLRIDAAGTCGTDFHIYEGLSNYNLDKNRRPISLEAQPQILGHEFSGTIKALGPAATRWKIGRRVVVDQVRTCMSEYRSPVCEFCESGDSHQCEHGAECGITGIQGAFAEYLAVPEANIIPIPDNLSALRAALVEPLGCVLHAADRAERSANRYWFIGPYPIRSVLILGGGPAGLLFLQYLRNIRKFDGKIVVADRRQRNLELAAQFGATAVDVREGDPAGLVLAANGGARFEFLIEATGNGRVFDWLPTVARRQATLLLYGAGHGNLASGCLTPWQAMEFTIATSAGASGRLGADGTPQTYARALRAIVEGQIDVEAIATHRYSSLEQLAQAFTRDCHNDEFVKGVMITSNQ
ncbi:MAG: zinc-dependent alcohol dehydrogenase [Bryobacteraceae bacterium]